MKKSYIKPENIIIAVTAGNVLLAGSIILSSEYANPEDARVRRRDDLVIIDDEEDDW